MAHLWSIILIGYPSSINSITTGLNVLHGPHQVAVKYFAVFILPPRLHVELYNLQTSIRMSDGLFTT